MTTEKFSVADTGSGAAAEDFPGGPDSCVIDDDKGTRSNPKRILRVLARSLRSAWRDTEVTSERPVEGSFRFIPECVSNLRYRDVAFGEP
jgi:hypothetical protein